MHVTNITERDRADLIELVDLLYKLSVLPSELAYYHAVDGCFRLFCSTPSVEHHYP